MPVTISELETALINADKAGDTDAARKLAAVLQREREQLEQESLQPYNLEPVDPDPVVSESIPPKKEFDPSLLETVGGTGEAVTAMATGMTTGLIGQIEGSVEGILRELASSEFGSQEAADRIEKLAMQRAQQFSYTPSSESGTRQVQAIGDVLGPLAAIPPTAEFQAAANAAAQLPKKALAQKYIQVPVQSIADEISTRVKAQFPKKSKDSTSVQSMGAAKVDDEIIRQARADELPVPIKLTKGQKTREFEHQEFEQTTSKLPEGQEIRDRFDDQNLKVQQNFDEFIDSTGSEVTDLRGVGEIVDKALRSRAAKDKNKIRALYKKAEKEGELSEPASLDGLAKYLNENRAERVENGIMGKVQRQIDALEVGQGKFEDGTLSLRQMTLKEAEAIRRFINRNTNSNDSNDIRIASALKQTIDDATENAGGDLYKQARAARTRYARDYENIGLVKNLLGTKKGSNDRSIALEDVLRKSILEPSASLDSIRQLRRLLQTAGEDGQQAWKELQGNTLRHMQDQMLKSVTTNTKGDRIVSAAQLDRVLTKLDQSGKLDFIFGKKGAEQLRTINDVAKDVFTSPPGTINTSNTATVLAGLMDVAFSGMSGVPAPIATSFKLVTSKIKDARLKARIKQTLE